MTDDHISPPGPPPAAALVIDDFQDLTGQSRLGSHWRVVTDQVMGGVSTAEMDLGFSDSATGRRALCLRGTVSTANNGGFVQVNLDLGPQ